MHALYHLPLPVLRRLRLPDNAVFRFLYDHHRHHHRLARMRWTNFNISMPLSDGWFGSLETEAAWRQERDRRAREQAESAGGEDRGQLLGDAVLDGVGERRQQKA
jgi:hypothetical protein